MNNVTYIRKNKQNYLNIRENPKIVKSVSTIFIALKLHCCQTKRIHIVTHITFTKFWMIVKYKILYYSIKNKSSHFYTHTCEDFNAISFS